MIAHLSGTLLFKGFDGVVVECGGVGYRLEVPLSTLGRLPERGEPVALHVHTLVREDAIRLFGFDSMDALRLFERLLAVPNIGPKLALSALSHMTPEVLRRAIVEGDVRRLSQISGIGKRTAERIVVDLADPLSRLDLATGTAAAPGEGARTASPLVGLEEALRYLGYKDRDIRRVLDEIGTLAESEASLDVLIKQALKLLQ